MFPASSPTICSTLETAQLLLVVSDGRGLFLEGKDRVLAAVQAARNANIFVIFVVLDNPSSRVSITKSCFSGVKVGIPFSLSYLMKYGLSHTIITPNVHNVHNRKVGSLF